MIVSFEELAALRHQVTMVDGSFDVLHPGHLAYFRAARQFGFALLVNICPDTETARKHPILLPAADRALILDALRDVRGVHISEHPTADVIRQLQPTYYVKGSDWRGRLPQAHIDACAEVGTQIAYHDSTPHRSSAYLKPFTPDVAQFADLACRQTPASEAWQPVTPWDFESRRVIEEPHAQRIVDVFHPKTVLDYGCGPGNLMRCLRALGIYVQGYEPAFALRRLAQAHGLRVDGNLEDLWSFGFDFVIYREVNEHLALRDMRRAITNLCRLSTQYVYGTTQFHPAPKHLLDVATRDDRDPSHISLVTKDYLRVLFALEGFRYREDLAERMVLGPGGKGRTFVFERMP